MRFGRPSAAGLAPSARVPHWAPSLLANGADTPPESSGTAFHTYGLAWGIQRGILDRAT